MEEIRYVTFSFLNVSSLTPVKTETLTYTDGSVDFSGSFKKLHWYVVAVYITIQNKQNRQSDKVNFTSASATIDSGVLQHG